MEIKKLTASFGKLSGDTLELHGGLNVICAPNESGKSTWCAFIRAMLYGVDSSERARAGYLPDKTRYAPWSGAAMEGSMELSHDGKDITITRTTRLRTAPMREFSAVYTGTNVPVEGMNGTNAGELLTGATKEIARRSAFIEQGAVAVSGDKELEKRIASIVSSGDESCSYSEADAQLRAWLRKRRFNRSGMLPRLENDIDEKKLRLRDMAETQNELKRCEERLIQSRERCEGLEAEVTEHRKQARKDALARLHSARQDCDAKQKSLDASASELRERESALSGNLLGFTEPEAVNKTVKEDKEKSLEAKRVSEQKNSLLIPSLLLILGGILALIGVLLSPVGYYVAILPFVGALLLFGKFKKTAEKIAEAQALRQSILFKYSVSDESELDGLVSEHDRLYAEYLTARSAYHAADRALTDAKARQSQTESDTMNTLDFSGGNAEAARLSRELSSAQAELERVKRQCSELRGRAGVMGDPLVISSELMAEQTEYTELQREYEAISLAVDTLKAADAEIQTRFSPELGRTAAEYMSVITGGRYTALYLNRDFSARTLTEGDSVAHDAGYLSAGTLDLMYLCLRLAICKLALPENAEIPLILDDTLVNLDPERTDKVMLLLKEIAKTRQVILFTCKKTEE